MNIAAKIIKYIVLPLLIVLAIAGIIDAYFFEYIIGKDSLISLVLWVSGCGALIVLCVLYLRTKYTNEQLQQHKQLTNQKQQNKQVDIQINKEIDDRFNTAAELLASNEISSRTAGIHSLYQLAIGPKGEAYRVQIVQILCSHIRSKTQEPEYQKLHRERPSHEIQTAIDILFRNVNGIKGIYHQNFSKRKNFPRADLSHAYLQKANFKKAHCQRADFSEAHCQKASFFRARCPKAIFRDARCQKTNFNDTHCQRAYFMSTQLQGAYFGTSQLQETNFRKAECQGVNFNGANCQGADFREAQCQGAFFNSGELRKTDLSSPRIRRTDFSSSQIQGTDFSGSQLQGVIFSEAQCQGVQFHHTEFQGTYTKIDYNPIPASEQLQARIKEKTQLENKVQFEGPLNERAIAAIENGKQYLPTQWHEKMEKIRKEHENKEVSYTFLKV